MQSSSETRLHDRFTRTVYLDATREVVELGNSKYETSLVSRVRFSFRGEFYFGVKPNLGKGLSFKVEVQRLFCLNLFPLSLIVPKIIRRNLRFPQPVVSPLESDIRRAK